MANTRTIGYLVRWYIRQPIATVKAEWFTTNDGANEFAARLIDRGFRGVTIEKDNVPY